MNNKINQLSLIILTILFASLLNHSEAYACRNNLAYLGDGIYSANPKNGELRFLTQSQYGNYFEGMIFHPNGKWAYQHDTIYSVDPDTGQLDILYQTQADQGYQDTVFHPRGKLAYRYSHIYRVDQETGQFTELSRLPQGESYRGIVFHPNGRLGYLNRQIYSVDQETGLLRALATRAPREDSTTFDHLTFHPNGKFAYQKRLIFSVDPETGQLHYVSHMERGNDEFTRIVFHPNGRIGYYKTYIYSVNPDTGRVQTISHRPSVHTYRDILFCPTPSSFHQQSNELLEDIFKKNPTSAGYALLTEAIQWSKAKAGRVPLDYFMVRMGSVAKNRDLSLEIAALNRVSIAHGNSENSRIKQIEENPTLQRRAQALLGISSDDIKSSALAILEADLNRVNAIEVKIKKLQATYADLKTQRLQLISHKAIKQLNEALFDIADRVSEYKKQLLLISKSKEI
jgi:hypothetical protein